MAGQDSGMGQRSKVFAVSRVERYQPNYDLKKNTESYKNISRRAYTRNLGDYDHSGRVQSEESSGNRSIIYDEF